MKTTHLIIIGFLMAVISYLTTQGQPAQVCLK